VVVAHSFPPLSGAGQIPPRFESLVALESVVVEYETEQSAPESTVLPCAVFGARSEIEDAGASRQVSSTVSSLASCHQALCIFTNFSSLSTSEKSMF